MNLRNLFGDHKMALLLSCQIWLWHAEKLLKIITQSIYDSLMKLIIALRLSFTESKSLAIFSL